MFNENYNELAEQKLIILYILDKIDAPITNSEFIQFVLENNSNMNYFYVQQYISELINTKFIKVTINNDKEMYELTELGKNTLKYFSFRIPKNTKSVIDEKYEKFKTKKIKETQILSDYFKKNETEYMVNLKVIENEITLFNLTLNVPSLKQAKHIANNWKSDSERIYKKIFDLLIKKDK